LILKSNSDILAVPVPAYIWSLTGTHLRISEYPTKLLAMYLISQKKINPQVFLLHPNELSPKLNHSLKELKITLSLILYITTINYKNQNDLPSS